MGTTGVKKRLRSLNALVAVLVAVILVLLGSMLGTQGGDKQATEPESTRSQQSSPLASLARRTPDDPLALGRVDAPVVMIAYEDFRCPFCAKFATDISPELKERYVETGVLRIEWRDFPIFGAESMRAAKAGRAAARQDAFWEFKDEVYAHAPASGHPPLPVSTLVEYARQAGVADIEQFKADMEDPAIAQAIQSDAQEGSRAGISSTPTFLVNGDPIMGAQPLPAFTSAIERAKANAR